MVPHASGSLLFSGRLLTIENFTFTFPVQYLNSGPGCIAGAYVNRRHARVPPQLRGWWSNTEATRMQMLEHCDLAPGVDGYRISNPPPLLVAIVIASLEVT